ncbi:MAG: 30S ribosomal protein S4 [Candidatus Margulisbacteria bacterium]|nr:30S ribosomal protein S4 [Candidatus Margulisiibacteriota bacterium]
MGLYKGPSCKLCRREGIKLYLKSDKCDSPKCSIARRSYPPGMHGPLARIKLSEYGIRLREKQKAKRFYYVSESQMRKYYEQANRMHGDTGEEFLQILESRLDNFVFRSGVVDTRMQARLMVRHGHFMVNKKKVDIPSYILKINDVVTIKEKSLKKFETLLEKAKKKNIPSWVTSDFTGNSFTYTKVPTRDELDVPVNEQFIVEFYSR